MAYRSLREFLTKLEAAGELVRVTEPVSTVLEMTEIQRRLLRDGGPAVMFENVVRADGERSTMPCLVNLFGTVKRGAMGVTLEGGAGPRPPQLGGAGPRRGPPAPPPREGRGQARTPARLRRHRRRPGHDPG